MSDTSDTESQIFYGFEMFVVLEVVSGLERHNPSQQKHNFQKPIHSFRLDDSMVFVVVLLLSIKQLFRFHLLIYVINHTDIGILNIFDIPHIFKYHQARNYLIILINYSILSDRVE